MKEKGRLGFIIQTWLERVIEISTDLAVHTGSGQFSVHFLFRKLYKLNRFTACFITRCRNEFGPLLPFMEPVQPASLFRGASTQPTHCIVVHTTHPLCKLIYPNSCFHVYQWYFKCQDKSAIDIYWVRIFTIGYNPTARWQQTGYWSISIIISSFRRSSLTHNRRGSVFFPFTL